MTFRGFAGIVVAVATLAGNARGAASESWTWAKLEPIVAARVDAAMSESGGPTPSVPKEVLEAVDEAVESTMPRIGCRPAGADTGAAVLAHARSARLMRGAVAGSLARHGVTCVDCAPAPLPVRDVTFVDLLPYALASTYVGTDDLDPDPEHGGFHLCSGGISMARLPDEDLGGVSLAAMSSLIEDEPAVDLLRSQVVRARKLGPKGDVATATDLQRGLMSMAITTLYRGFLATDATFLASLRKALAVESEAAGLRCTDCLPEDPLEGTWSLRWRRSVWQPRVLDGAMSLRRVGDSWTGSAWVDTVDRGEAFFDVRDPHLDGSHVSFTLHETWTSVTFDGRLLGSTMEGSATWQDPGGGTQRDAFSAVRRDVARLDEDATGRRFDVAADPAAVGLDPLALDQLVLLAEEADSDALIVVSDGKLACDRRFGSERLPMNVASITKAISSLAIAFLEQDGKIDDLDAHLSRWYPEFGADERLGVTLRQILSHATGLDPGDTQELNKAPDQLAHARAAKLVEPSGTKFVYNNRAMELLSGIVEAESGQPIDAYLGSKLFQPLGMRSVDWPHDGAGHPPTYGGLALDAMDLAVLGQALADGGHWYGKPVIPATWIDRVLDPPASPGPVALGWFQVAASRDDPRVIGFMHSGDGGQYLFVFPQARLVVVRQAGVDTWRPPESAPSFPWLTSLAPNLARTKMARGLTPP
jgi:CubicO group peptidase (beta-lactamase class C family)